MPRNGVDAVPPIRILLLSNRDSDNVGDQIIEATAISLIRGAVHNLGLGDSDVEISSRAAGIISKKYMQTGDPALLNGARRAISSADVLVFGGAPLFNYSYQNFYLRTITTLNLANEYGVPVIFSSIGVEPFDPTNPKCLALKEALALPCVQQITTRDDYASLQAYVEGTSTPVAHVADPAVFADIVFRDTAPPRSAPGAARPRVGLVVTRAGIFKDNGIAFSEDDQRAFWLDTIRLLTERGYDYRLFTTGHFSDEVFLDSLLRETDVELRNAAVTVNSPEELIREIRQCQGIIAYRLHASITAFAFDVPSIGLSWNFKVPHFYESVNHGDRALAPERWNAQEVVAALERAIAEGVRKDEGFLTTVYDTLYSGLRAILAPDHDRAAFTYHELKQKLPRYPGTSEKQYREKVTRKLCRTYESYQKLARRGSRPADGSSAAAAARPTDAPAASTTSAGSDPVPL